MTLKTYDDFVSRIFNGFDAQEHIYGDMQTAFSASMMNGQSLIMGMAGATCPFPTLPTGVTGYIVISLDALSTVGVEPMLVGKAINLGNIDISGTSGTFTPGSTMPTITEGGVSNQSYSGVIGVVTTALNSAAGSLTITYNANDGTTGNATTVTALTNSAAVNTAGLITLNSGHWGASAITAATRSGGTSPTGVITFYGFIPLCIIHQGFSSSTPAYRNLITDCINPLRLGAGDTIKFILTQAVSTRALTGTLNIVGDS